MYNAVIHYKVTVPVTVIQNNNGTFSAPQRPSSFSVADPAYYSANKDNHRTHLHFFRVLCPKHMSWK